MTRMTENLQFPVTAVEPSGLPQYSGGKLTATRQFLVPCNRAEELALRAIGKWRGADGTNQYTTPQLPSYYPYSYPQDGEFQEKKPWPFQMVVSGFSISAQSKCCFNSTHYGREAPTDKLCPITDLQNIEQAERYYPVEWSEESLKTEADMEDQECVCVVTLQYEEQPWDCTGPTQDTERPNVDIMQETAICIEKNPGIELYTLPNRGLLWDNADNALPPALLALKGDSYATISVPVADIVIDWFNVPVDQLCNVEYHLNKFRGCVNSDRWTLPYECSCIINQFDSCNPSNVESAGCGMEAETILFVDWEELKEQRTRGFMLMDTTTLRLHFKQKRIVIDVDDDAVPSANGVVGHNHLFCDSGFDSKQGWRKVLRKKEGGVTAPLYDGRKFNAILLPGDPVV